MYIKYLIYYLWWYSSAQFVVVLYLFPIYPFVTDLCKVSAPHFAK